MFVSTDSQNWSHVISESTPPSPRYGHSAVVFGNCMYIYGGFDKVKVHISCIFWFLIVMP